ncbi:hypothetical protein HUT18_06775 [Streptomyces sp. NA04227]|uniref:effector-associated constant component EACC1 n=1 Tax=Streptomyces sp. NA04227 TaxID=2742136 RepID=UPI00159284CC|nr:hypothetical protein [Streptomyces sp. NA04227]QKW06150.1 hypothetical protein HUT18_06775 [Streptomyces sp. NA04227]
MRLELRFPDGELAEEELRSLHMWLLADPAARRHAGPELGTSRAPVPGAQGDLLDVVSLVVGSGFNAATLALSLVAWRGTRPQQPTMTVERPDGMRITVAYSSAEEARRLIESLTDGPEGGVDRPADPEGGVDRPADPEGGDGHSA